MLPQIKAHQGESLHLAFIVSLHKISLLTFNFCAGTRHFSEPCGCGCLYHFRLRNSFPKCADIWICVVCASEAWIEKPSYGKPLEEHLTLSGREIAFPIEACVTMLLECGMQEEVRTCWSDRISVLGLCCIFQVCDENRSVAEREGS